MKLSHVALGVASLIATASAVAESQPTCRWLHLDGETRVFQCAILPAEKPEAAIADVERLPDPTLPLEEQKTRQAKADPYPIPAFLKASLPFVEEREAVAKPVAKPVAIGKTATARNSIPELVINQPTAPAGKPSLQTSKSISEESSKTLAKVQQPLQQTTVLTSPEDVHDDGPFMVLARGDVDALKAQLDAEGEHHYMVLKSTGAMSLGVYATVIAAEKRRDWLATIGVDTDLTSLAEKKVSQSAASKSSALDLAISPAPTKVSNEPEVSQVNRAITGYLVATLGDQERIIEQLKDLGAKDFVALNVGPYQDRVSLGVYSSFENALARQDKFKQLGVDSELISRDESAVVRTTIKMESRDKAPASYGFDQLALNPMEI